MTRVDYDRLSSGYDRRYQVNPLVGVENALRQLVGDLQPALSLEVGCGSGRWLPTLAGDSGVAIGVDRFVGMLAQARHARSAAPLVCADGAALPFLPNAFDLVASVNALHHVADPAGLISRCAASLQPGGGLAIVHYDPAKAGQWWYVYDAFAGTREGDLARFPRLERILDWMRDAGLRSVTSRVAETIERNYSGREVLDDYFLGKDSNSTLAGLTDAAYETGVGELHRRIERAEAQSEAQPFEVRMELLLLAGRKP